MSNEHDDEACSCPWHVEQRELAAKHALTLAPDTAPACWKGDDS
jgi:hypothetical protein